MRNPRARKEEGKRRLKGNHPVGMKKRGIGSRKAKLTLRASKKKKQKNY